MFVVAAAYIEYISTEIGESVDRRDAALKMQIKFQIFEQ